MQLMKWELGHVWQLLQYVCEIQSHLLFSIASSNHQLNTGTTQICHKSFLILQSWLETFNSHHQDWGYQEADLNGGPPLLWLTSRKSWLDLQPVDIKSRWSHNWKSAQVVNSHLVCDPTIRQPGFNLPQQQWSLLNRFCAEQGHCGRKWRLTDTDLCPCGKT